MTESANDTEWLEWIEVQKNATKKWLRGEDRTAAIGLLDRFLARNPASDVKREAIAYRGTIREDQGDLAGAKSDLLEALRLAEDQDHVRFELEDSIGVLCQKLGDLDEADEWYSAALRTAAADPRVAGGGFLRRFMALRGGENLSNEEQRLLRTVVHQSWHLLRLDGEPDLGNLEATCEKLLKAQGGPFSAERPPAPKAYRDPSE